MLFEILFKIASSLCGEGAEPSTSGLEKAAPPGELDFLSRSNQKNNMNLLMFFQIDLETNSSSPEGAACSRPDLSGSGGEFKIWKFGVTAFMDDPKLEFHNEVE